MVRMRVSVILFPRLDASIGLIMNGATNHAKINNDKSVLGSD